MSDVGDGATRRPRWLIVAVALVFTLAAATFLIRSRPGPLSFAPELLATPSDWKTYQGPGYELRHPPSAHIGKLPTGDPVLHPVVGEWRIRLGNLAPGAGSSVKIFSPPIAPGDVAFHDNPWYTPYSNISTTTFQTADIGVRIGDATLVIGVELYPRPLAPGACPRIAAFLGCVMR